MKKYLSFLLAVLLMLSALCLMTACGEEDEGGDETTTTTTTAANNDEGGDEPENLLPEALANVPALPVDDLSYTGWTLSGGMVDNVEMEEADLQVILNAAGGRMDMIFLEDGVANLQNGETIVEGTYEVINDNYAVHASFEKGGNTLEYYGCFTTVGDVTVLMLVNPTTPNSALYMALIEEG